MRKIRDSFIVCLLALALAAPAVLAAGGEYLMYVGTYTNAGKSQGIYAYRFQSSTGQITPIGLVAELPSPSFFTIHPNQRWLYAISEITRWEGQNNIGPVSAYAIDRQSGKLTLLNRVSARGSLPCFVSVDATGGNVLVANYIGGNIASIRINADGSLGESTAFVQHTGSSVDSRRQRKPFAHSINLSPDNRFAIVADLGLDKVLVYRFDAKKGSLEPNDPPSVSVKPGSGPRHFAFHPSGKYGYVINEMGSSITAFSWDKARGAFKELQTISTIPEDFKKENNCAEVQVHPSGRFVYGSNRGHDSIAVFAVDPARGTLTAVERVSTQGVMPRNFRIDPTGNFMVAGNQRTDNMIVYRIDRKTGRLTPTGQMLELGAPVCIKFVPSR